MPKLFTNARDPNNPIIFANNSFLFLCGFSREELIGQKFNILLAPGASAEMVAQVDAAFSREAQPDQTSTVDLEIHCRRKNGSNYWASLLVSPVYDEDGVIVQFFASLIDITKYKEHFETELRMQELQSEVFHMSRFMAMGEMAANLAHELNQPLSAIANYLKGSTRILEHMVGPEVPMLRDALSKAADQALRAGAVIRHLRDFVTRGESERTLEALQGLVEDASHLALMGAKESGLQVAFEFAHRTAFVLVTRIQIQQVLLNLIRNAFEAMHDSGERKLVIRTSNIFSDSMVQVSVVDTGPGIAPAVLDRLFTPFTTTKESGMGVGLSICQRIIASHEGTIWAESVPGKGSTFHFTLRTVGKSDYPEDG